MTTFTAADVAELVDRYGAEGCSDIHLTPHRGVLTVKYKQTTAIPEIPQLDPRSIDAFAESLFEHHREGGWTPATWQAFASIDQARDYRARATFKRTVHGTAATLRIIPRTIPTAAQLGLPRKVVQLAHRPSGFIGIAGPTGSGKSSTMAACLADLMNTVDSHVYMLEDPAEFLHFPTRGLVTQRELGTHFRSYEDGIKDAKGSHPRVIVIGEIRDGEVAQAALDAALSGHLVITPFTRARSKTRSQR
ncbi:ATPase, T2SS/T4P/T4SS family [Leifsonia sp. TF02-11]|uniref:ATPase, T2SS/T4P/T4SS family n=1 Tax=Leifsonia sp. TF02-11 TaxID=2815212 RepID=UPI001AA0FF74|nr:ATPase, T2SS/T4P/T4SS family [Leifsonia sp. TF02-11]MBO1741045.1 Flp pilus assembly complex ATPase component TadA [Leifsonia sp. TF02-11]